MRRIGIPHLAVAFAAWFSIPAAATGAGPVVTAADYERAERATAEWPHLVQGAEVRLQWVDAHRAWYLVEDAGGFSYWWVDAERGARRRAFDEARMAAALARAAGAPPGTPLPRLEDLRVDGEQQSVEVKTPSGWWRVRLDRYEAERGAAPPPLLGGARDERSSRGRRGRGEVSSSGRGRSPDGAWSAAADDRGNLVLRPSGGGDAVALTDDAGPEATYAPAAWSADGRRLLAWRTRPGERRTMTVLRSVPEKGLRPEPETYPYALPGDRLDEHRLVLFDVPARKRIDTTADPVTWGSPPRLRARPDGLRFLYEQTDRGYGRVRLMEIDAEDGRTRTVIEERSTTFVAPMKRFTHFVDGGREILWASERDGWNHLYRFDGETGRLINRVTEGAWPVFGVLRVDEENREIVFRAGGREPGRDPYYEHVYRVGFDGSGLTLLTPADGTHEVRFSPDRTYLADTWSRADQPPVTELRRAADGSLVCELARADASRLLASGWRIPRMFSAKGRDDVTDIYGIVYYPSTFNPSNTYPVIEQIYAGPHEAFVPKAFGVGGRMQEIAELGFLVVQIDGMGTSLRSKAFHDVCWKNLADGGFPDRVRWLRALAAEEPSADLSRVGIFGGSAGGYNAVRALIDHPDVYKAASANSGNYDHRTDKVWWNELWMGWPVGEHYREQSVIEDAARIRGALQLIHGELDTNVNPAASTLRLADALIRANRDFELILVPGEGHCTEIPYVKRRTWDFFVRTLHGAEPPREYAFRLLESGRSCFFELENRTGDALALFWLRPGDGRIYYRDIRPGDRTRQHSYAGHRWEVYAGPRRVAEYTVREADPAWVVGGDAN